MGTWSMALLGYAAVLSGGCAAAVQGAPKLRVAIVGSGLAGLSTAVELLDQGYEVSVTRDSYLVPCARVLHIP